MQPVLCVQLLLFFFFFTSNVYFFPLKRTFEYRVSEAVQGNIFDYVHTATECGFQPCVVLIEVMMWLWVYC